MFFCNNRRLKIGCKLLIHYRKKSLILRRCESFTSGIIVTGDEVLKGQVVDTNSYFLCKKLYEIGVRVVTVSKVADNVEKISSEVKKFSEEFDYVLTTGGVGPTHDDVTYEAVGKAFNDKLFYHPELSRLILDFYKTSDTSHPALKMAYIPTTAKLTYGFDPVTKKRTLFPNVSVKNVFMFPGVPHLCERLFNLTQDEIFKSRGRFYLKNFYLKKSEVDVVDILNSAVEKFPDVLFGSYPQFFHSYYDVKFSMESVNESKVKEAFEYLKQVTPQEFQLEYDENPFVNKSVKIEQFTDRVFFRDTLGGLRDCIKKYSPDNIFLYFDGGKNSTVLVHILSALYEELFSNSKCQLNAIYVEKNPKINRFVKNTTRNYNLNLLILTESNFKSLAKCSSEICIIKGTRSSDPNAANVLKYFESLPVYNPISQWTYADVWKIIRGLSLPYCELYDQGYTSICHSDSSPNPHLITAGARADIVYYKKAYELTDLTLENSQ